VLTTWFQLRTRSFRKILERLSGNLPSQPNHLKFFRALLQGGAVLNEMLVDTQIRRGQDAIAKTRKASNAFTTYRSFSPSGVLLKFDLDQPH
jgi:hypothetical protein